MLDATVSARALQHLRAAQLREGVVPLDRRRAALKSLRAAVLRRADALSDAVDRDFNGRSRHETRISEIAMTLGAIDHALPRLARWAKPERVAVGLQFRPASAEVLKQPMGVVGLIAPWNYPVQLALLPLAAALSAGCRAVLKPSEHTPATAALLAALVGEALEPELAQCVTGGATEAAALASLPFDKLMFTGSTATGRLVARAAAENLVPTLLELGGKSPAIIDPSADVAAAAKDIVAGKLLNAGQTCVAPDYVLVPRDAMGRFIEAAKAAARRLYPDPASPDYSAICRANDRARLLSLAEGMETVPLFDQAVAAPRVAPMLVIDPPADSPLMREEIFGPLLPLVPYDDIADVYRRLADGPDPLALYWFGSDRARERDLLERTRSGGVCLNDTVMHVAVESLPFGGLGASGMGAYHGQAGFDAFTHRRAVFRQHRWSPTRWLRPPYGRLADRIIGGMIR